ncbi:YraN family protein [Brevibacterium sp. 5221]|uniref:UPF0102 protein GSY69_08965 n=1 Tax=Brevibacterium rongguiense TaxID=2695267 RepID=A0A6N9H891_9MICO|nr:MULTISPECIES: YraN family protein [Brevibacterium]MYM20091.1 YraN family protein [Brevibacterium rongguiense]WAL41282.1 YraN family protein [Brevibacterium sp. BRM-1]
MGTQTLGRRGEDFAHRYLTAQGWDVLARNWRCRAGEIDIVARDGATIVFVEVKTRGSLRAGHPLEAIGYRKLRTLRELAVRWLTAQPQWYPDFRVDVLGILWNRGDPHVTHVRDAQ